MREIIVFVILLIANSSFAQNFNDMKFESTYSTFLADILKYDDGYLLTGNQFDSSEAGFYSQFNSTPIYIKLDFNGNILDTIIDTSIDKNETASFTILKDSFFYTFGSNRYMIDSSVFVVTKRDLNFHKINRKVYQILSGHDLGFHSNCYIQNSTIMFMGTINNGSNFYMTKPVIVKYDLDSMLVLDYNKFSTSYLPSDFSYNSSNKQLKVFSMWYNYYGEGILLTYDSAFTLISQDTLFYNDTNAFDPIDSYLSHMQYRDSMHIVSGVGAFTYGFSSPVFYVIFPLTIQILDSNFNIVEYKSWHYDSLSIITTPYNNGLVKNDNNEYFVGGYIRSLISSAIEDVILVVKTDSNLNTIWKKVLKGNGTELLYDMEATDDGGVLVLYSEIDTSITDYTILIMNLKKIGSNGEVTSIFKYKTLRREIKLEVYPNPASNNLNIRLKNYRIKTIRIIDITGKVMLVKQLNAEYIKIDVSNLAKGFYIIEGVTLQNKSFSAKFIKRE